MRRISTLLLLASFSIPAFAGAQSAPDQAQPANAPTPAQAAATAADDMTASGPQLTLDEAVKQVRENNYDLKAARARLLASDQTSRKAWAGYLPQATVQGTYQHNSTTAKLAFPDFSAGFSVAPDGSLVPNKVMSIDIQQADQFSGQATVTQALLAAPLIPAIRNAYTAEEIAKLSTEQVQRELLFGAAQAFYGAVGLKEAVAISREQLDLVKEHLRTAEAAFKAGTVPQLAVLRARIDVSRAEQDLNRSLNGYAAAKGALAVLMGRDDIDFEVASLPPGAVSGAQKVSEMPTYQLMLDQAYQVRPDVKIADLNLELNQRSKTGVWAQFLPTIGAAYNWRWSDVKGFTGSNNSWTFMITASWNLFDGGLRYAQLREAEANILQAKANIESTRNKITQEIRQARLDIESAQANLSKSMEQVRLARANWQATEKAFNVGAASSVDVTDAVTALRTAEIAKLTEAVNLKVAEVKLQKAIGMGAPAAAIEAIDGASAK